MKQEEKFEPINGTIVKDINNVSKIVRIGRKLNNKFQFGYFNITNNDWIFNNYEYSNIIKPTDEEIDWFLACEEAQKFIPLENIYKKKFKKGDYIVTSANEDKQQRIGIYDDNYYINLKHGKFYTGRLVTDTKFRKIRLADFEEVKWLNECIKLKKFIPKNEALSIRDPIIINNNQDKTICTIPELIESGNWYCKVCPTIVDRANNWRNAKFINKNFVNSDHFLLPSHPDKSGYWASDKNALKISYPDVIEITVEEWIDYVYNPWKKLQEDSLLPKDCLEGLKISESDSQTINFNIGDRVIWTGDTNWRDITEKPILFDKTHILEINDYSTKFNTLKFKGYKYYFPKEWFNKFGTLVISNENGILNSINPIELDLIVNNSLKLNSKKLKRFSPIIESHDYNVSLKINKKQKI